MYNSEIDNNTIPVELYLQENNDIDIVECKFDTGAMYTVIPIKYIASMMNRPVTSITNAPAMYLSGIISGKSQYNIEVYPVKLKALKIGNITLENRIIFITYDNRVKVRLLGMDIISKLYTYIGDGKIYLSNSKEEIIKHLQLEDSLMLDRSKLDLL